MKSSLFLMCCLICCLFCQVGNELSAQRDFSVRWFTDADGLPQNSVKDIFKDRYGYIWLSTESGLVRYDGRNFKVFHTDNVPGLTDNRTWFFDGDMEKDTVFTTNQQSELLLITQRKVQKVSDSLHFFTLKKEGAKMSFPLEYYSQYRAQYYTYKNDLHQVYRYSRGKYIVDMDSIRQYDLEGRLIHVYHHDFEDRSQYFVLDSALYVVTGSQKFYAYTGGVGKVIDTETVFEGEITVFTNSVSKQVFIYNQQSLYLIGHITGKKIEKELLLENFDIDTVNPASLYYDKEHAILYLGSYTGGLGIIKKQHITVISTKDGENNEYALTKLNDSTVITSTGKIIQNQRLVAKIDFDNNPEKYHIAYDKNQHLWLIIGSGLYRFEETTDHSFSETGKWTTEEYIAIDRFFEKEGKIWVSAVDISTENGVLYGVNPDETPINPVEILRTKYRISIVEPKEENTFYIGSHRGFYLVKKKGSKTETTTLIPDTDIRSIYKDGDNLWLGSYDRGFFLYRDGAVVSFPLDRDKYLISSHCFVEDENGFFWIPTNKGLFRVSKENLYKYADGDMDQVYYQYYDKSYGLATNEFNGGCYPCGIQMDNADIYFPSLAGVVAFAPSALSYNATIDPYIDEVEIDGRRQSIRDTIHVDRNFERIKIFVSCPYHGHPYNVQVEARLERDGEEKQNWTALDSDQSVSYTSLPPGDYAFTTRSLSGFDFEYRYEQITLVVPHAFWQTVWFKALFVLAVLGFLFFVVYLRIRYIKKQNIVLEKKVEVQTVALKKNIRTLTETKSKLQKQLLFQKSLVNSISHDLKTPMKYMLLMCKDVVEKYDNNKREEQESIEHIHHSANQIANFIDKLLVYTRVNINEVDDVFEEFNIYNTVENSISFFKLPAAISDNTLKNKVSTDLSVTTGKKILEIIIQNLLDNSLKNTRKGVIQVRAYENNEDIHISIKDTGTGVEPEKLKTFKNLFNHKISDPDFLRLPGLGFKIIYQLLSIIDGKMEISNRKKGGTHCKLIIPKRPKDQL